MRKWQTAVAVGLMGVANAKIGIDIGIAIGLVLFLFGAWLLKDRVVPSGSRSVHVDQRLRIAHTFFRGSRELDPAKILAVYEYELLDNLYSRLIEIDNQGQFHPGVADSFSVVNDEIVFKFGDKVITIDGRKVGALDAAISLKRLILFGKSGHGDIRRLLCPNHKLKSVNDDCPGIRVEGRSLILRPPQAHHIPLLFSTLESADYGIIPQNSLNLNSPKIEIIDYRNTSGPYFIEKDSLNGYLTLKANPKHFHYDPRMPQTVDIIPSELMDGPQALLDDKVDMVTTAETFSGEAAQKLFSEHERFNVFATLPIRVNLICFSRSALQKFTVAQRFFAAKIYAQARQKLYPTLGAHPTSQFFQALSDGTLSSSQMEEITALRKLPDRPKFEHPIEVGVMKAYYESYRTALQDYPEIRVVSLDQPAFEISSAARPDMFGLSTDSAWTENLSLLGYNFEIENFHMNGLDPNAWFESYLAITEKEERIRKINQLHFDLLRNAVIYPFNVYPYFAVTNKNWSINFSKLSSDTALWQLRSN